MEKKLLTAFNLSKQGVISIIGGGGKTSLMFKLAKSIANSGGTVLTTSTTKIFYPSKGQSPEVIITPSLDYLIKKSNQLLKNHPHFSAGTSHDPETGKVIGFPSEFIDKFLETKIFDWIIVEADGARRKPIKASNNHEPVLPQNSTHLVIVAGLDAIGTPLNDRHVHRPEIFSKNTELPMGALLTENTVSKILAIEMKKAKRICPKAVGSVFLNKADMSDRINSANKIAAALKHHPAIDQVIIASLHNNTIKVYSDTTSINKGDL